MANSSHPALLPAGLADILPPDAATEADATESLMSAFGSCGYERVKPPLIEFEDTLMSGSGAATADQSFRLMDPVSQRMLALRADMTIQIARIATTRFSDVPRPLRLSYAGQVLRVKGSTLRPERQFGQAGAELIGSDLPSADAEVILMAYKALQNLGIENITIDLGLPTLVRTICDHLGIEGETARASLREALNQKDAAAVAKLGDPAASLFGDLLKAVGAAPKALECLLGLPLPPTAQEACRHLESVVTLLKDRMDGITLTIDPVEIRGFEYHSGVTFTLFAPGIRGELGRDGRYEIIAKNGSSSVEQATGVTLFVDTIMRSLPAPASVKKLYAPAGADAKLIMELRNEGWVVIEALADGEDTEAEARRLGCSHVLKKGKTEEI